MFEDKTAEIEEQTETASDTVDTEQTTEATAEEQEVEETTEQATEQADDSQTQDDVAEDDTPDNEEAKVPSYRLREETQRRRELEAKLKELESNKQQEKTVDYEQLDSEFQEDVNKYGFTRAMAKWVQPMAQNIASKEVGNIKEYVANQQIEHGINQLIKQHPEASNYADKIKEKMNSLPFEYKTNPNAVKTAFSNILGEEVLSGNYQKTIEKKTKDRITKDKKILGETAVGDSKGGSTAKTGLTSEQEGERERLGLSKDSYKETLAYHQKRDKDAGKPARNIIYKTT
jgi:hypothetical protein